MEGISQGVVFPSTTVRQAEVHILELSFDLKTPLVWSNSKLTASETLEVSMNDKLSNTHMNGNIGRINHIDIDTLSVLYFKYNLEIIIIIYALIIG